MKITENTKFVDRDNNEHEVVAIINHDDHIVIIHRYKDCTKSWTYGATRKMRMEFMIQNRVWRLI